MNKSIYGFIHFILLFIIFFNSWLLEIVHLNRYGKDSFLNYFFLISQTLVVLNLLVRNTFDIKFILATLVLLSVILSVQHIMEYILTDNKQLMIKKLTEPFSYIHTGRTLALFLGLIFIDSCYWFIFLAFTISQLFPSFISRSIHVKDINFSHLTSHLFIITNTIAISLWLSDLIINITINIILLISIVFILLLAIYRKIFKTIDRTLTKQSGNTYIIGIYFTILELVFINLFFVLEYDWKYFLPCYACGIISNQCFNKYKK
jgi:putative membrane protein